MTTKYFKISIALVLSALLLDMISTYGVTIDLLGKGLSLEAIQGMERNPIITYLWDLTGNFQAGIFLNYLLLSSLLTVSIWYLLMEEETTAQNKIRKLITPVAVNCFFVLGFLNNSLYLFTGESIGSFGLNMVYILILTIPIAVILTSEKRSEQ